MQLPSSPQEPWPWHNQGHSSPRNTLSMAQIFRSENPSSWNQRKRVLLDLQNPVKGLQKSRCLLCFRQIVVHSFFWHGKGDSCPVLKLFRIKDASLMEISTIALWWKTGLTQQRPRASKISRKFQSDGVGTGVWIATCHCQLELKEWRRCDVKIPRFRESLLTCWKHGQHMPHWCCCEIDVKTIKLSTRGYIFIDENWYLDFYWTPTQTHVTFQWPLQLHSRSYTIRHSAWRHRRSCHENLTNETC